jgi:hypothetical protein
MSNYCYEPGLSGPFASADCSAKWFESNASRVRWFERARHRAFEGTSTFRSRASPREGKPSNEILLRRGCPFNESATARRKRCHEWRSRAYKYWPSVAAPASERELVTRPLRVEARSSFATPPRAPKMKPHSPRRRGVRAKLRGAASGEHGQRSRAAASPARPHPGPPSRMRDSRSLLAQRDQHRGSRPSAADLRFRSMPSLGRKTGARQFSP